jgi:hypothetical protein
MFGRLPDLHTTHPAPLNREHRRAAVGRATVRQELFYSRVEHPFVDAPVNGRESRVKNTVNPAHLAVRVYELLTI